MKINLNNFFKILLFSLFLGLFSFNNCYAQENKNILFISSYSYDWIPTSYILDGFNSNINVDDNVDFYFMDTKNVEYELAKENFSMIIESDYSKYEKYDVIVVADDNALDYVIKYRDKYFNNKPIVFLGINDIDKGIALANSDKNITGIIEKCYYDELVELAIKIYPNASNVYAVTDNTTTGIANRLQMQDIENNYPTLKFNYIDTTFLTRNEIINELASIDKNDILIYLNFLNCKHFYENFFFLFFFI